MHYIGMMAMRMPAMMIFNYLLVCASVLIAVVISFSSLLVICSPASRNVTDRTYKKAVAAILAGLAISSMHYTGMLAVSFVQTEDAYDEGWRTVSGDSIVIFLAFFASSLILLPLLIKNSVYRIAQLEAQKVAFLKTNERKLMRLIQSVRDAVIVIDSGGLIKIFNDGAVELFGYMQEEVINRNIFMLMPEPYKSEHDGYLHRYLSSGRTTVMDFKSRDLEACDKSGRVFPVNLAINDTEISDEFRFIGIVRDMSEERNKLDLLHRKSRYDSLTGVLNRSGFRELFTQILLIADRQRHSLSILYIDLDGFKLVNDSYGHHVGDVLLHKTAKILRDSVRKSDLVARLGGDEFCVVLSGADGVEGTLLVVNNLLRLFSSPLLIEDKPCSVTISIGVSQFPKDGNDYDALIKRADEAMYVAKKNGKNQYVMF